MRYLNKIIFINSATIPYAEVPLDGNIHFIGTQGVGKSTVLRAILFFYNADSRKLGIPKGPTSKSFVDWYLKHTNSYIIYEVIKETGAFCVLAFKSQNRVCYRFIDTPYKSEYFIKETHEAFATWDAIRERLDADRVNVSPIISSFDDYRDILFGNYAGKREYKRYALLEAKQYKNIYRTIQNVFLNTKLDADEIKQTIISSMEEENTKIDLEQYDHHLKDFEKQLNDIKSFRYPSVQRQANSAITNLSALRHLQMEQNNLAGQLKYRLDFIEQERPLCVKREIEKQEILNQEKHELNHLEGLFHKRENKIKEEVIGLNNRMKDSKRQKSYYASKNIEELISRVAKNEELKLALDSLKKERTILTNQHSDIQNKFDALISEQQNQFHLFRNQKEEQKIEIDKQEIAFVSNLHKEYGDLLQKIEEDLHIEIETKEASLLIKSEAVHNLNNQKTKLEYTKLYDEEIIRKQKEISEAQLSRSTEINNCGNFKQQIETLQTKWDYAIQKAENDYWMDMNSLKKELNQTIQVKQDIEDKIAKSSDSLYGWLNQNRPNWESTIGKVIDEKLLFQDGLSPKLSDNSTSLYGVNIHLEDLEIKIKTIEDYRFEIENYTSTIEAYRQKIQVTSESIEKQRVKIQRRYQPKIKELKEKIRQSEFHAEQLNKQIEKEKQNLNSLIQKAQTDKIEAISILQKEINSAISVKEMAFKELKECKEKLRKAKENKQKEKTRRINKLCAENQITKENLQHQINEKKGTVDALIANLKTQQISELHSKGADTNRIIEIDKQITTVDNELLFIEKNRSIVSEYEKDKRELFDKVKEFSNKIDTLNSKLQQQQSDFNNQKELFLQKIDSLKQEIHIIEKHIEVLDADVEKYNRQSVSEALSYFERVKENIATIETEETAINIIDKILNNDVTLTKKNQELRENIDKFLSHFSKGNLFNFPTRLIENREYIDQAEELNNFIEDNLIEHYEKLINERFADIIKLVGKETTSLISKTGEIKRIINKINADFRQKNFVTAINNIELGITDSKNSAVILLKKIKAFNDENAHILGEANLFSGNKQDKSNERAVDLLKQLVKEINQSKNTEIKLTDSFELTFRIEENGNDTGWVEKLSNVGSEGTDVLVKAMINIMLLNVFKEGASRRFKDFKLHCMMDEIGKLHPTNVKGILHFANDRNILLINGSPTENTPLNYRHIFKISKDSKKQSTIKRIVSNPI
ncbi:ATP-binding protein [Halosquirtibacter laminarini]|uniref:ATP-binding protein n=1 Tax=Halosquirtibacter laminarini TaxID=3374600 RepID=A0AC61NLP9_9BACT|nr:ATP-binding protein [Prolixibacteraceae bacterium]